MKTEVAVVVLYTLCVLKVHSGSDPQDDEEHGNAWRCRDTRHIVKGPTLNAFLDCYFPSQTPVVLPCMINYPKKTL